MRHFTLASLCLLCLCSARAQGAKDTTDDNISIAVAMPADCTLDNNTKSILKNKLLRIVSSKGTAGTEYGGIVIVPDVDEVNSSVIDGGMRKITTVELSVTATVLNMITGTAFNTIQTTVTGEAYSKNDAIRAAIGKIKPSDPEYAAFMKTTKAKIADYYKVNTATIITKANALASQRRYDEALALLATYPEALSGYPEVAAAMSSIFQQSLTMYCSEILMSAQAAYARRDFAAAADQLALIDAQSSCAPEAKTLLAKVKQELDKERAEELAMQREEMREAANLKKEKIRSEKAKAEAAAKIIAAYFKSQTKYVFL